MNTIYIEDHVVPQLFTTAIEAYEFMHKNHKKGKGYDKLETFGLLWGYVIAAKGEQPLLAHMIVGITKLNKKGWAYPSRLKGSE